MFPCQTVNSSIDKRADHIPTISDPREGVAPFAVRFIMEMRSRPAVPPVVEFRCDMLSPSLAEAEGKDKRRRSSTTSQVYGDTLSVL